MPVANKLTYTCCPINVATASSNYSKVLGAREMMGEHQAKVWNGS
jgi:hypothetical protein